MLSTIKCKNESRKVDTSRHVLQATKGNMGNQIKWLIRYVIFSSYQTNWDFVFRKVFDMEKKNQLLCILWIPKSLSVNSQMSGLLPMSHLQLWHFQQGFTILTVIYIRKSSLHEYIFSHWSCCIRRHPLTHIRCMTWQVHSKRPNSIHETAWNRVIPWYFLCNATHWGWYTKQ